jgi:hypothetical protein
LVANSRLRPLIRKINKYKEVKQKKPPKIEEAMKTNYEQKARHPSEKRSLSTLASFARAPNGQWRWETMRPLLMN